MDRFVENEGVWETAKDCVGRAHDEEQLVKWKVEMLQMFKAFGKAEWWLGHSTRKSKASVLKTDNLVDVESMAIG